MAWDSVKGRLPFVRRARLFRLLNGIPLIPNPVHILHFRIPEHMWMPANQLIFDRPGNIIKIKRSALIRHLRMEHHLQQEVPQFHQHLAVIARLDGVDEFVHFLHRVQPDALMVLFLIPRTSIRRAQTRHNRAQFLNRLFLFTRH